jgi:EAL domain-containing protein (putative c-di-GMP-specific phosphodiesterase class I)
MNNLPNKILVLDDDPFTLKLLINMLANLGCNSATVCDNGRIALEEIDSQNGHPDLILLDLNMPEMDGVEFVRRLADRHYSGDIILISGESERMLLTAVTLVQAHKIPVLGHLHKPITQEGLAALLEKWSPPSQGELRVAKKIYSADEVRIAIANGELVNYYQPKVMVATGRVMGVETLVRWRHPRDGMVLPGQFIGVAETHGLIDGLSRVVLAGALTQAKAWQEAGLVLQLAVNLSMNNLASLDFADFAAEQATAVGVPPQQIVLEVAENLIPAQDLCATLETLARLHLKRFRLSIDDFGIGHSSLSQLRDIPFDELKIDRSIVHGACADKSEQAKYDACLGMARQFGMEVVAEGVEDRDDWNFLHRTRCDLAQGYFIAQPMPATDLPGWMENWWLRAPQYLPVMR